MCLHKIEQDSVVVAGSLILSLVGNGKTLKVLELAGRLSTVLIGTLAGCTHIQSLRLEFDRNSPVPGFLWNILSSMAALQRLYLEAQIDDVSPATLSLDAMHTRSLETLQYLELVGPPGIVGV